jgi:mRNA interferase MazF
MPLMFHPEPGTILMCDFAGFREPEMVKLRPVIVVSPKLKHRDGLLTVVPLSTTPPLHVLGYHCEIAVTPPLPKPFDSPTMWVKGDMIYNVAFSRLELLRDRRDRASGRRRYFSRQIEAPDLIRIQRCVLEGLGLSQLTGNPQATIL